MSRLPLIVRAVAILAWLFVGLASNAISEILPGTYSISRNVSDGILNMRSGPGLGHSIIIAVPAGSTGVQVSSCRAPDDRGRSRFDWCRAVWNGHSGWLSSRGLRKDQETAPAASDSNKGKCTYQICFKSFCMATAEQYQDVQKIPTIAQCERSTVARVICEQDATERHRLKEELDACIARCNEFEEACAQKYDK